MEKKLENLKERLAVAQEKGHTKRIERLTERIAELEAIKNVNLGS